MLVISNLLGGSVPAIIVGNMCGQRAVAAQATGLDRAHSGSLMTLTCRLAFSDPTGSLKRFHNASTSTVGTSGWSGRNVRSCSSTSVVWSAAVAASSSSAAAAASSAAASSSSPSGGFSFFSRR
eukprot:6790797-Prymnesium_polylepis.2